MADGRERQLLAASGRSKPGRILEEHQRLIAIATVWDTQRMPKPARTRTKACAQRQVVSTTLIRVVHDAPNCFTDTRHIASRSVHFGPG